VVVAVVAVAVEEAQVMAVAVEELVDRVQW
jgi:hypothetical protein